MPANWKSLVSESVAQDHHQRVGAASLPAIEAGAYERYRRVREWATRIRDGVTSRALTTEEQGVVSALTHLWDAPPDTIARLRRFCDPISGIRASDYDAPTDELNSRIRRGISTLRRWAGPELLVPEPPALGGFGCEIRGELFNEETLAFFHALVALQDGAVLQAASTGRARHLVWEMGGGWGGFGYQFKTLHPDVTYVVSGLPDTLLVAATYLTSVMQNASCRFLDRDSTKDPWEGWERVDFIFVPDDMLDALRPPRVDLVLDVMSLGRMDPAEVRRQVRWAFECRARYVYSLRSRLRSWDESAGVWQAISELYWPHPVPPRAGSEAEAVEAMTSGDYAHLMGWRRVRV